MAKISSIDARRKFKEHLILSVLFQKPLRLFCDHCDKYVPSDMPWICGHCDKSHAMVTVYSFLNKCRQCKRPPKAFECPHCRSVNFLDHNEDASHPARKIGAQPLSAPQPPLKPVRSEERQEERFELEHQIIITRLANELAALNAIGKPRVEKSVRAKLEESLTEQTDNLTTAHELAAQAKARNAILYAGDPEMLERCNESVDWWLETQMR